MKLIFGLGLLALLDPTWAIRHYGHWNGDEQQLHPDNPRTAHFVRHLRDHELQQQRDSSKLQEQHSSNDTLVETGAETSAWLDDVFHIRVWSDTKADMRTNNWFMHLQPVGKSMDNMVEDRKLQDHGVQWFKGSSNRRLVSLVEKVDEQIGTVDDHTVKEGGTFTTEVTAMDILNTRCGEIFRGKQCAVEGKCTPNPGSTTETGDGKMCYVENDFATNEVNPETLWGKLKEYLTNHAGEFMPPHATNTDGKWEARDITFELATMTELKTANYLARAELAATTTQQTQAIQAQRRAYRNAEHRIRRSCVNLRASSVSKMTWAHTMWGQTDQLDYASLNQFYQLEMAAINNVYATLDEKKTLRDKLTDIKNKADNIDAKTGCMAMKSAPQNLDPIDITGPLANRPGYAQRAHSRQTKPNLVNLARRGDIAEFKQPGFNGLHVDFALAPWLAQQYDTRVWDFADPSDHMYYYEMVNVWMMMSKNNKASPLGFLEQDDPRTTFNPFRFATWATDDTHNIHYAQNMKRGDFMIFWTRYNAHSALPLLDSLWIKDDNYFTDNCRHSIEFRFWIKTRVPIPHRTPRAQELYTATHAPDLFLEEQSSIEDQVASMVASKVASMVARPEPTLRGKDIGSIELLRKALNLNIIVAWQEIPLDLDPYDDDLIFHQLRPAEYRSTNKEQDEFFPEVLIEYDHDDGPKTETPTNEVLENVHISAFNNMLNHGVMFSLYHDDDLDDKFHAAAPHITEKNHGKSFVHALSLALMAGYETHMVDVKVYEWDEQKQEFKVKSTNRISFNEPSGRESGFITWVESTGGVLTMDDFKNVDTVEKALQKYLDDNTYHPTMDIPRLPKRRKRTKERLHADDLDHPTMDIPLMPKRGTRTKPKLDVDEV